MEQVEMLEAPSTQFQTPNTFPIQGGKIAAPFSNLRLPSLSLLLLALVSSLSAQPFQLPTANRALFEKGGEERFFVGTTGKPWPSGTFGCVRTEGWQLQITFYLLGGFDCIVQVFHQKGSANSQRKTDHGRNCHIERQL